MNGISFMIYFLSNAQLKPNAKDWRLLLQIDSNEENNYMWGDSGRLYFWIRKVDLAENLVYNPILLNLE